MEGSGFPFIDGIVTGGGTGKILEEKKESYYNTLRKLKPGVNEIILHLGMDDDEMRGIMNNHISRYHDYKVFTDPETRKLIAELQIELIGWKDISALMKK